MLHTNTSISLRNRETAINAMLNAWIDAKAHKSGSEKTKQAYIYTMNSFRETLFTRGEIDIDGDPRDIRAIAQYWAGIPHTKANNQEKIAASTFNQRLAIISSFYRYARKMSFLQIENPIDAIERRRNESEHAMPLTQEEVRAALNQIDRTTLAGKRDYALISLALHTGRRVSEIAAMIFGHLKIRPTKRGEMISVHLPRLKGGKIGHNDLEAGTSTAIIEYLHDLYGADLGSLDNNAPIWVSLSHNKSYGAKLQTRALERICERRVGNSKFHTLRSTSAVAMEDAGAKVSEIQAHLGHESLATTGKYLATLRSGKNKYASQLENMFGINIEEDKE